MQCFPSSSVSSSYAPPCPACLPHCHSPIGVQSKLEDLEPEREADAAKEGKRAEEAAAQLLQEEQAAAEAAQRAQARAASKKGKKARQKQRKQV